jgi:hypothetical protein
MDDWPVQLGRAAMNIFGAVTFGSLIKTFLPGLVWLIAFVIVDADLAQLCGYESYLWKILANKDVVPALLILAFPSSILIGLLSNVVVFMGLNDLLVRNPFKRKQATADSCVTACCWQHGRITNATWPKWQAC